MLYLLRYEMADGADLAGLRELFPRHQDHWQKFLTDGSLVAIGPMEEPSQGALAVFRTRESAELFARGDPFVTSGLVGTWSVSGWREAILG